MKRDPMATVPRSARDRRPARPTRLHGRTLDRLRHLLLRNSMKGGRSVGAGLYAANTDATEDGRRIGAGYIRREISRRVYSAARAGVGESTKNDFRSDMNGRKGRHTHRATFEARGEESRGYRLCYRLPISKTLDIALCGRTYHLYRHHIPLSIPSYVAVPPFDSPLHLDFELLLRHASS